MGYSSVFVAVLGLLAVSPSFAIELTPEAAELKLKREFTGLGYAPEVTREAILEYVRARRGGGPFFQDEEKPDQLVLIDADGKRWTSETDGGVVEVRDSRGRTPFVFETKTEWFKEHGLDRMQLSLEALKAAGAVPDYRYGGGHIHVKLKGQLLLHPVQFASLVNLSLTYEPILVHLMTHHRRLENARPLSTTRMSSAQLEAAGLPSNDRSTLAQYLGRGLNRLLTDSGADCRTDARLARYFTAERKPEHTVREGCLLAFLAHFGTEVVGDRTFAVNLQSWRGAASRLKRHESLELRLFNAVGTVTEAELEEKLVRAMGDRAIRSQEQPILYEEKFDPVYDLDSYYVASFPTQQKEQFAGLLKRAGFSAGEIAAYLAEYLDPEKHAQRRSR